MFDLGIIFLAFDTLLMAGILAFIFFVHGRKPRAAADGVVSKAAVDETVKELREELKGVKKLAIELDRRSVEIKGAESSAAEKQRRLDELVAKVEEALCAISNSPGSEYAEAIGMIKRGAGPEELTGKLGLLKGEAELLANIVKYRC